MPVKHGEKTHHYILAQNGKVVKFTEGDSSSVEIGEY
jgi:hypothetical protein